MHNWHLSDEVFKFATRRQDEGYTKLDLVLKMVRSRLASWQSKFLPLGGWVVLIKSVWSSIPIFYMSVNMLLKEVKRKLHEMFSRFLWGGTKDKKKVAFGELGSDHRSS